ncbi:MAG: hypothetical protein ACTHNP_00970 [Solirubrobacterales bacterium]
MGSARLLAIAVVACLAPAVAGTATAAALEIEPGSFKVEATTLEAGAHPDLTTSFAFTRDAEEHVGGSPRNVIVDLPVGLAGYVSGIPTCTPQQLSQLAGTFPFVVTCPVESQVGTAEVTVNFNGEVFPIKVPVFNMTRDEGQTANFAFIISGVIASGIVTSVDPADHHLRTSVVNIAAATEVVASKIALWGVPNSSSHDVERGEVCIRGAFCFNGNHPAGTNVVPLIRNPTECTGAPLSARLTVQSWENPSVDLEATAPFGTITDCSHLQFGPTLSVQPSAPAAGAPSGYDVDLRLPQNPAPGGISTSDLREAVVTLPKGVRLSTASADGLRDCTDAQFGIGTAQAVNCPPASKIGTAVLHTPSLPNPLTGAIYLGGPPAGPITGPPYRLLLVLEGEGVSIKLAGEVQVDPNDGQITTTFRDNPQLPFEDLELRFTDGPRAPLVNPDACGTYTTSYTLTPWSGNAPVRGTSSFDVTEGCSSASQFSPGLEAGTTNPVAGSFSPFLLRVTRPDGQQNLGSIEATLPKGLLAKLAGIPVCADPEAAVGSCSPASQVGTVTVASGAGSNPLFIPQPGKAPTAVYLAGPYKGAPYSFVVKVPAQAGPFDLGLVVVRTALYVDHETAQVTAKSDPLPQILQGIPIDYRDIRVEANRHHFTLNPTSCDAMRVDSTIRSAGGAEAHPSARFQVGDCAALRFSPKLTLKVAGPTNRNAKPRLRAVVRMKASEANIARAEVNLPPSELLEQSHIKTICTRVQFAEGNGNGSACPKGSIYGHARAITPLLDKPLEGPVFLRSSSHKLPDLVAALNGQIDIALAGKLDSGPNGGLRNTFEVVPDAPVSKFVLEMKGGKRGLLVNSENLCSPNAKTRAIVQFTGQNGKVADSKPKVANSCATTSK